MKKILVGYPLDKHKEFQSILNPLSNEYSLVMKDYDYKWLKDNIYKFDVLIPSLKVTIDDEVIKNARNLRLVFTPTTGTDHIRIEKNKRKITILTLNDYREQINSISSTAELGFSLLLSLSRKVFLANTDVVKSGRWERNNFLGKELNNKVMGVIGMGRIGQKIASYGKGFGMDVIYWDKVECKKFKRIKNLDQLLSSSDYIVVSVFLNARTHYLINRRNINSIKKGCFLVNISRGKVIEERALCSALKKGILLGVGVDVLELELEDHRKSPLYKYAQKNPRANIIITPHIGGATIEAWKRVFTLVFREVQKESFV